MTLDRVQVAVVRTLRGENPGAVLRGEQSPLATAAGVARLELFARGVTIAAELCVAVGAAIFAVGWLRMTPSPMYAIDARGLRLLATAFGSLAAIAAVGAGAALRWPRRFWWIQLVVGCGLASWYAIMRSA